MNTYIHLIEELQKIKDIKTAAQKNSLISLLISELEEKLDDYRFYSKQLQLDFPREDVPL